jgi:hypothetical protein
MLTKILLSTFTVQLSIYFYNCIYKLTKAEGLGKGIQIPYDYTIDRTMSVRLFRYSLSNDEIIHSTNLPDYVVKLPKNNSDPTLEKCIFFTNDSKMNTYEAHDYLSLTYYPKWCYEYDLAVNNIKLKNNRGKDITSAIDNGNGCEAYHCWPSFGQHGGSKEIILVGDLPCPDLQCSNSKHFLHGGETDEYHQDNTANYDQLIGEGVAQLIVEGFRGNEITFGDGDDNTIGLIKSGTGLSLRGNLKDNKFISVSSGIAVYGSSIRIKLWATVWKDDIDLNQRYIYGPEEREMTFCLRNFCLLDLDCSSSVREALKSLIKDRLYPYNNLYDLISTLIRKVSKVSDGFFNTKSNVCRLR